MAIANQRDSNRTQLFTCDALNRILFAKTQGTSGNMCWGQAFGYDPWGNLSVVNSTQSGCTAPMLNLSIGKNNQINSAGFSYDAAGDLLTDGVYTYTWNAEGLMATVTSSLYGSEMYIYDGDGQRVRKQTAGRLYWYGAGGEVLAETALDGSNPTEYIFFGGRRIARRDSSGNVSYYLSDMLGSSRVVADSNGNLLDDCDFLPYGDERCAASTSGNHYLFTGMERDSESGLDHTLARQYASNYGRWLSPDPGGVKVVKLDDPQTWNMYGYVRDLPTTLTDPTGLDICSYNQSGHQTGCIKESKWHNFWYGNTYKLNADNGKTYNLEAPLKELKDGQKYTIVGAEKTSSLMNQFVAANGKHDNEPKPSLSTVERKSSPGRVWDFKHQPSLKSLGDNLLFVIGQTAHQSDDIGNMTWGYIMSSYGFSRITAHAGAGWQSWETYRNLSWCVEAGCDDPKDYQNIEAGYTWQETGTLPSGP